MANYLRSRTPCNRLLAGYFTLGTLDKQYRYDMNDQEAYELLKKCVHLIVNLPSFKVKIVRKDGISDLENIKLKLSENYNQKISNSIIMRVFQ